MAAGVVKVRSRWAAVRADKRVRDALFHLRALTLISCVLWGAVKLCTLLPREFERPCHLAGWILARVAALIYGR